MNIIGIKAVLERQGFEVGYPAFPQTRYTEEEKNRIFAQLTAAGM